MSQSNIENPIQQAFQRSAVEILYNPYQGLKLNPFCPDATNNRRNPL
ncbi:hypothetical protein MC7420_875 [Coleofasciculus chthonoplastes PCC 7420]|uniref:Uncharacterized protein n=1 Tax=Coleofasciculus chthonoplastes PCC 7420 TaxID=118168 RepID=B4VST0_9CYAN|nr:hypothetical protein MC7420_875 [Coleofasciculus chthonoplastes PCC 7420]